MFSSVEMGSKEWRGKVIKRKIYWRRKENKIIAEGKQNNKTIFLFTLPEPEIVAKSSLFTQEKQAKISEKISRLDYKNNSNQNKHQELRTINIVRNSEKDDFDSKNRIKKGELRELAEMGDIL